MGAAGTSRNTNYSDMKSRGAAPTSIRTFPRIRRYNVTMLECFPRCIDVCMPPGDYTSAETFIKPKKMQPFIVILLRQSTRREKSPRSCWSRRMELIKRCGCGSGFPGTIERRKSTARDLQPTVEPAAAESESPAAYDTLIRAHAVMAQKWRNIRTER